MVCVRCISFFIRAVVRSVCPLCSLIFISAFYSAITPAVNETEEALFNTAASHYEAAIAGTMVLGIPNVQPGVYEVCPEFVSV